MLKWYTAKDKNGNFVEFCAFPEELNQNQKMFCITAPGFKMSPEVSEVDVSDLEIVDEFDIIGGE